MNRVVVNGRRILLLTATVANLTMGHKRLTLLEQQITPLVLCEVLTNKVALITLNRPAKLNALCQELWTQLNCTLRTLENNPLVHVIVLTGTGRAFAAGAEVSEFANFPSSRAIKRNPIEIWSEVLPHCKKPVIAAVNGFALGGGCELAMMCDIILAHETAKFSQPEIKLGLIPGAGGTQRLTRAIGKYKTMFLVLTGNMVTAKEAADMGLVSKVVRGDVVQEAVALGAEVAGFSLPVLISAKKAVNSACEGTLRAGLDHELQLFNLVFSLSDKEEGIAAFLAKRKPKFINA